MLNNIIRKFLENLSIFFQNNLTKLKFSDDEIYNEINSKLKVKLNNSKYLKKTHKIFNENLFNLIKKKKLKKFLIY